MMPRISTPREKPRRVSQKDKKWLKLLAVSLALVNFSALLTIHALAAPVTFSIDTSGGSGDMVGKVALHDRGKQHVPDGDRGADDRRSDPQPAIPAGCGSQHGGTGQHDQRKQDRTFSTEPLGEDVHQGRDDRERAHSSGFHADGRFRRHVPLYRPVDTVLWPPRRWQLLERPATIDDTGMDIELASSIPPVRYPAKSEITKNPAKAGFFFH